jgi:dephospho-CoA kinase
MARDGASAEEVARRMAAQWPMAAKRERADYVIETDGTLDETDAQVDRLVTQWGLTAPKS